VYVCVSGNALAEDQEAFLSAGCCCVLTKPCSISGVQGALHKYLAPEKAALVAFKGKKNNIRKQQASNGL